VKPYRRKSRIGSWDFKRSINVRSLRKQSREHLPANSSVLSQVDTYNLLLEKRNRFGSRWVTES
jgi:hypothetical protein